VLLQIELVASLRLRAWRGGHRKCIRSGSSLKRDRFPECLSIMCVRGAAANDLGRRLGVEAAGAVVPIGSVLL
jgi:hypothetical protein